MRIIPTIAYENHLGYIVPLNYGYAAGHPGGLPVPMEVGTLLLENDLLNYDWSLETADSPDGYGGRVIGFRRGVTMKKVPVQIWTRTNVQYVGGLFNGEEIYKGNVYLLQKIFDADIIAKKPGKLYVGDWWVKAYVVASEKTEWNDDLPYMINTLTFAIESAYWNMEEWFNFPAYETMGGSGFRYPGKYPAKYCMTGGVKYIRPWLYDRESPMVITVYGPAQNPAFTIAGNVYTVLTEITEGERLVIDQLERTVHKITATGDVVNEFNNRGKESSVFEPIPAGYWEIPVYYSGNFAFEVKLYTQVTEPILQESGESGLL